MVAHKPTRIGGCDADLIDAVAIRIGRILEVGSDLKRQRAGDRMKSEQSPVGIVGRIGRDRVAERVEIPIGRRRDAGDGDVFGKVDDPRGGCELRGDVHVDHGHRVPRHHVASAVGGPHDHLGDIVGADVSRGRVPRPVCKSQQAGRAIDLEQPGIDAGDHGKRGRSGEPRRGSHTDRLLILRDTWRDSRIGRARPGVDHSGPAGEIDRLGIDQGEDPGAVEDSPGK